ncbi:MAG TPA: iron export ABC transporter permease subunit FetB [Clostridia bacterium]|nr:iron export ABC transporter permease subunit FetB [Clostridia bacterium]
MSLLSLTLTSSLILIPLIISKKQGLKLEADILVGTIRAVLQLALVGFILKVVFGINDWKLTLAILLVMIFNAAFNGAKRGKGIPGIFPLVIFAISSSTAFTLLILVSVKALSFQPAEVIPVGGMIIGNSMIACSLTTNRLREEIKTKKLEIEARLALGATPSQAVKDPIRLAIRTGMIPTTDTMKTLGIVQLPGMMTGLILAGTNPMEAIKYQLMVMFMLSAAVSISCMILGFLLGRKFFNAAFQLNDNLL